MRGCSMKIEPLKLSTTKRDASTKPSATAARPFGPAVKPLAPGKNGSALGAGLAPAAKVRPSFLSDDRRRTQRVMLRVRANIHVALHGKESTLEVTTLSVNHHGAIVVMPRNLPVNTQLVLEHGQTKEKVVCKVARAAREMAEGFQVPIEFDSPAPGFWKIAFPPTDWRPE
jgi:hypothetical protein